MCVWEMVRVRVLFLDPGNLIHPSELDHGISDYSVEEKRMIYGEDYDPSILKVNSAALADALRIDGAFTKMVSSPSDPVMELRVPMTVVYFDIMEVDADWGGRGALGDTVENIGIWETFGAWYDVLVEHARLLLGKLSVSACKDEWGTKVQFMTMWQTTTWTDYAGESDSEHDLIGWFNTGMIQVRKFGEPLVRKEFPDALQDILDVTPEEQAKLQAEARQLAAIADADAAAHIEHMNRRVEERVERIIGQLNC